MSRLVVFSTILVLLWPGAVLAQSAPANAPTQDDDFDRKGFYVGIALGGAVYTEVKDDLEKESLAALGYVIPVDVEAPPGLDARVGYRFHRRLAGEVQLQWFPKADIEFADTKALKLETLTVTANAKGYLLTGRIQPFVVAGAGLMHFKSKDNLDFRVIKSNGDGFATRFGAGVDFYVTENIVAVGEGGYVLPFGPADGLDYVFWSVGLQSRF